MKQKTGMKLISGALLFTTFFYNVPIYAFSKDETVYSKLNSSGESYNTLVNSHLINEEKENLINDLSDLINIKNVNGDEKFKQDGNKLVWDANGADIYYSGETKKELPIECIVKYELNRRRNFTKGDCSENLEE